VILLVNKGTEGWNCPSLFATALARKLKTSNNFVLQAATRCLRQVPGNTLSARIYLSDANRGALDRQLTETYGETLAGLNEQRRQSVRDTIVLRKTDLPPLRVRRARRELHRIAEPGRQIVFTMPSDDGGPALVRSIFDVGLLAASRRVLMQVGDSVSLEIAVDTVDVRTACAELSRTLRAPIWEVHDALAALYPGGAVPVGHMTRLAAQLEATLAAYEPHEIEEEVDLEIAKPDGWDAIEEISYPADRAALVWPVERTIAENRADYGYHYNPYNFDSTPESEFYEHVLRLLNVDPHDVQDVYYTGGITDPKKTDLSFAYDDGGRERRYTPDFVVHAHGDRWLLVEIKMTGRRDDRIEGADGLKAKSLRALEASNPGRVLYRIVFADAQIDPREVSAVRTFVAGPT
jgi:hypothetical protein